MKPHHPVGVEVSYQGGRVYSTNITGHDTVTVVRRWDRLLDREAFVVVVGEGAVCRDCNDQPVGLEHEHLRLRCDFAAQAEQIASAFLLIAEQGKRAGVRRAA